MKSLYKGKHPGDLVQWDAKGGGKQCGYWLAQGFKSQETQILFLFLLLE